MSAKTAHREVRVRARAAPRVEREDRDSDIDTTIYCQIIILFI